MGDHSYGGAYADWQAELREAAARASADRRRRRWSRRSRAARQAVTSNVAVSSAAELPPTHTSNVEGSSTQSRSTAFQ